LFILLVSGLLSVSGCGVRYSFSGGSIPTAMNTVTVHFIENRASMVFPTLSETMTEGLKSRIRTQSRLSQVTSDEDAIFEGSITDYSIGSAAVEAGTGRGALDRLFSTFRIKYTNYFVPEYSFVQPFSRYKDF